MNARPGCEVKDILPRLLPSNLELRNARNALVRMLRRWLEIKGLSCRPLH